jgi:hypothetical protein
MVRLGQPLYSPARLEVIEDHEKLLKRHNTERRGQPWAEVPCLVVYATVIRDEISPILAGLEQMISVRCVPSRLRISLKLPFYETPQHLLLSS